MFGRRERGEKSVRMDISILALHLSIAKAWLMVSLDTATTLERHERRKNMAQSYDISTLRNDM